MSLNHAGLSPALADWKTMKVIPLSDGRTTTIDDYDYETLSKHNWFAWAGRHTTYAVAAVRGMGNVRMHRLILGLLGKDRRIIVDHRDGNGLNNTRGNLRICTISGNLHGVMRGPRGKSGYRGVSWHKATGKWAARISLGGKRLNIGLFNSEIDAAYAYDVAKLRLLGSDTELSGIQ